MEITPENEATICYGRILQCIELELAIESGVVTTPEQLLDLVRTRTKQLWATYDQAKIHETLRTQRQSSPAPSFLQEKRPPVATPTARRPYPPRGRGYVRDRRENVPARAPQMELINAR